MTRPRRIAKTASLLAGGCLAVSLWAGSGFDGEYLTRYQGGIDTPHVVQARPWAGGRPRVLFIVGRDQGQGQEVREITQRADFDYEVFFTARHDAIGADGAYYSRAIGVTAPEKEAALLERLAQPWDVIVLGSVRFSRLPATVRHALRTATQRGTGIVAVRYRGEFSPLFQDVPFAADGVQHIRHGVPLADLYAWNTGWHHRVTRGGTQAFRLTDPETGRRTRTFPADAPFETAMLDNLVACFTGETGRFVSIDDGLARGYWGPLGCFFGDQVADDLASLWEFRRGLDAESGLFIRAILWAAGLAPRITIRELPPTRQHLAADTPFTMPLRLTYTPEAPTGGLALHWSLTDALGHAVATASVPLDGQPTEATIALPPIHAADFLLHVSLRNAEGGIEDWGHAVLRAETDVPFGPIALEATMVEAETTVRGVVPAHDGARVRVTLRDRWQRELIYGIFEVRDGEVFFELPLPATPSMRVAVIAELLSAEDQPRAMITAEIDVPQSAANQFLTALWPAVNTPDLVHFSQRETLAEAYGVNAVVMRSADPLNSVANLHAVWREHYLGRNLRDVFDPEARAAALETIRASAATARRHSRRTHLVADEVRLSTQITDHARSVWRAWLRERYHDDIEHLNAVWDARFASFDEIDIFTPDSLDALRREAFPRYLDHRLFREHAVGAFVREVRDLTADTAPETLTGMQYLRIFPNDAEWLASGMDVLSSQRADNPSLRLMRDLAAPGALVGGWSGGYFNQRSDLRRHFWTNLIHGYNSLWLFIESGGQGILAADGRIPAHTRWMLPDYRALQSGLGDFITRARRLDDGVAMLHDFGSIVAAERFSALSRAEGAHRLLDRILSDHGIPYRYIGPRALAGGILREQGLRTLILPFIVSLGEAQAAAIRDFVREGGTVIADIAPGLLDGYGRPVEGGMLADVFGVRQHPDAGPAEGEVSLMPGIVLPFGIALTGVEPVGATAAFRVGETAAGFENRFGRGTARLLNFTPFSYNDRREMDASDPALAALADGFGVASPVRLTDREGQPLAGIEVINRFELDGRILLAILPDRAFDSAVVRLAKPVWIHDLRRGIDLGQTDRIELTDVRAFEPLLFGIAQEPIESLDARFIDPPRAGQSARMDVRLAGRSSGRDLLYMELRGPDGRRCPWASGSVELRDGQAVLDLPVAANEAPGNYILTLTDVLSGRGVTAAYTLPPAIPSADPELPTFVTTTALPLELPPRPTEPVIETMAAEARYTTCARDREVLNVRFRTPVRSFSYRMPLDPERPGMPEVGYPRWQPASPRFSAHGLNGSPRGHGEWLLDLLLSKGTAQDAAPVRVFSHHGLYAWGVVEHAGADLGVMHWRGKSDDEGTTLLFREIPDSDWTLFLLETGAAPDDDIDLVFESIPQTYYADFGSLRRHAVIHAGGEATFGRDGIQWAVDDTHYWALCHNLDSQQRAGVAYVMHPADIAGIDVRRGRHLPGRRPSGVRMQAAPGRSRLRFALAGLSGQPWPEMRDALHAQAPTILEQLNDWSLPERFRPTAADIALHDRLNLYRDIVDTDDSDHETVALFRRYFRDFETFRTEGLTLLERIAFFHSTFQVEQNESEIAKGFLIRDYSPRTQRTGE